MNEVQLNFVSGKNMYFCVRNDAGKVAYLVGNVFETWGTAARDANNYATLFTAVGGDHYVASFPSWIAEGEYAIQVFERSGATPVDADKLKGSGTLLWDGSQERSISEVALQDSVFSEPSGIPPGTTSVVVMINYLYRLLRNKKVTDKGPPAKLVLYKDDGSTPFIKATLDDDGSLFTKGAFELP